MIIGIDCDGVLTDMYAYNYTYGKKHFKREPSNLVGDDVKEMFGLTEKEEFRFGLKYFFKYCKSWPPRNGAAEIVGKLKDSGHKLYEITARKFATQKSPLGWYSRYLFERWLEKYNFQFDDIFYCDESTAPNDKLISCEKLSVDVMIDDKSDIALHLANHGIRVLLFNTEYNQGVSHDNIVRVYDWYDIYEKIGTNNCFIDQ